MDEISFTPANEMKKYAEGYRDRQIVAEVNIIMQEIYMAAKHGSYGILKDSILPENVKALQDAGYKVVKPAYDGMKFTIEWR